MAGQDILPQSDETLVFIGHTINEWSSLTTQNGPFKAVHSRHTPALLFEARRLRYRQKVEFDTEYPLRTKN